MINAPMLRVQGFGLNVWGKGFREYRVQDQLHDVQAIQATAAAFAALCADGRVVSQSVLSQVPCSFSKLSFAT